MSTYSLNETGFNDAIHNSQQIFRVALAALSNPCVAHVFANETLAVAPAPLSPAVCSLILTLCDYDTKLWLSKDLRTKEIRSYLQFYASVVFTENPNEADFAVSSSYEFLPELSEFKQGDLRSPNESTTIILDVANTKNTEKVSFKATGPGILEYQLLNGDYAKSLGKDFDKQWAINNSIYPLGVDMFLVNKDQVLGLPRTTRLVQSF